MQNKVISVDTTYFFLVNRTQNEAISIDTTEATSIDVISAISVDITSLFVFTLN
jgi:hypothetical protein